MRNRKLAIISGLGIIAVLLALTPDPVAARGGFRGGGGLSGRGAMGTGNAMGMRGFRGGGFAGRGAMGGVGFRRAAWGGGVRPGWGVAAVGRPGWGGGWRGGWG